MFDGSLVCVIRDNNHNNYPCQVAFSFDNGESWTEPTEAPFSGDRPFIGQLADGRLLVTYRNQGGNRGTYAWLGDITREHRLPLHGSPSRCGKITLDVKMACTSSIRNPRRRSTTCCPRRDYRSEILFDARVRVAGERGENCAFVQIAHVDVRLQHSSRRDLSRRSDLHEPAHRPLLARRYDRVAHRSGCITRAACSASTSMGEDVLRYHVLREARWTPTYFGTAPDATGESWWQAVKYHVRNPTEPEHLWLWEMHRGAYPDQYEPDRVLELHANTHAMPDNGYSTWHQFADGEIRVLDYTNQGDPLGQAHVVACALRVGDFETMARRGESVVRDMVQKIQGER